MVHARRLASTSSYYLAGNVVVTLVGLVSLPVWTRLLTQSEYGLLSLVTATVSFLVIVCKFGLQHASLRFYSDVETGKLPFDFGTYYSTMFFAGLSFTAAASLLTVGLGYWVAAGRGNAAIVALLIPAAIVVALQSINNSLQMFLRAEQRARLFSAIQMLRRCGRFALAVSMALLLGATVRNMLLGWIIAGSMIALFMFGRMLRLGHLSPRKFSPALLRQAVAYGFPLIWAEVSNITLALGDRYILQYFLGERMVGIYSVGYNISALAQSLLAVPLRLAVVPAYLSMWNEQGEEPTRKLLGRVLNYYLMLGIPLAVGMIWFRREILVLLTSERYSDSQSVVPLIIVPLVLYGAYTIYGAGLFIHKKTAVFMWVNFLGSFTNVGLNFVLIPRMGILGAAWATLVSYSLITIIIVFKSSSFLKVPVRVLAWIGFVVAAVGTTALTSALLAEQTVWIKIPIVAVSYVGLIFLADAQFRHDVRSVLRRA
jgi:O-antigen/teichoic acid export membrane protein